MQPVSDETRTLRRTMRDLVALSALPAVWAHYQPPQVAQGLADVLLSTLRLDLVYIRLPGQTEGQEIEVARTARGSIPTDQTRDIGRALAPWLNGAGIDPATPLPNLMGSGPVRIVVVPIGCGRQDGVLVAGSQQAQDTSARRGPLPPNLRKSGRSRNPSAWSRSSSCRHSWFFNPPLDRFHSSNSQTVRAISVTPREENSRAVWRINSSSPVRNVRPQKVRDSGME